MTKRLSQLPEEKMKYTVFSLALLSATIDASTVRLIPSSSAPEYVWVQSQQCLQVAFGWRAESLRGTLKLYAPVIDLECPSETYVSLSHACVVDSNCQSAVNRVELIIVPSNCSLAQGIPECARAITPELPSVHPFTNFRSPERLSLWEASSFSDPPGGSETLLFERQGDEVGLVRTRRIGSSVSLTRLQGTDGPVMNFVGSDRVYSAFRVGAFSIFLGDGRSGQFYGQYTLGRGIIFPGGVSDPVRMVGKFRVVDPSYPGKTLELRSCTERYQPVQCELLIDDRYPGQLNCDEERAGKCDVRFGDGIKTVNFRLPRSHFAYDAWFGPSKIDVGEDCCIYFADAIVVRVN